MPNQTGSNRFKTYDEQIDILTNQKGLIVTDKCVTKNLLINIWFVCNFAFISLRGGKIKDEADAALGCTMVDLIEKGDSQR